MRAPWFLVQPDSMAHTGRAVHAAGLGMGILTRCQFATASRADGHVGLCAGLRLKLNRRVGDVMLRREDCACPLEKFYRRRDVGGMHQVDRETGPARW